MGDAGSVSLRAVVQRSPADDRLSAENKKTSNRVFYIGKRCGACRRGLQPRVMPSEAWSTWCSHVVPRIKAALPTGWRPIDIRVNCAALFYQDVDRADSHGLYQGIEESRSPQNGQTGMFGSTMGVDDIVLISLHTARYEKTKRGIKDGLLAVRYPNQESDPDGDELSIHWKVIDGRSVAEVPRWAADRLKKIADGDKALDFKIGDLAKLAEKLSTESDGVTVSVQ